MQLNIYKKTEESKDSNKKQLESTIQHQTQAATLVKKDMLT